MDIAEIVDHILLYIPDHWTAAQVNRLWCELCFSHKMLTRCQDLLWLIHYADLSQREIRDIYCARSSEDDLPIMRYLTRLHWRTGTPLNFPQLLYNFAARGNLRGVKELTSAQPISHFIEFAIGVAIYYKHDELAEWLLNNTPQTLNFSQYGIGDGISYAVDNLKKSQVLYDIIGIREGKFGINELRQWSPEVVHGLRWNPALYIQYHSMIATLGGYHPNAVIAAIDSGNIIPEEIPYADHDVWGLQHAAINAIIDCDEDILRHPPQLDVRFDIHARPEYEREFASAVLYGNLPVINALKWFVSRESINETYLFLEDNRCTLIRDALEEVLVSNNDDTNDVIPMLELILDFVPREQWNKLKAVCKLWSVTIQPKFAMQIRKFNGTTLVAFD